MGKSLIIYSFSLLFVFFISCSRKAEVTPKEEPIIAIIMKCSDIKDQPSCERKTIAGKPCEWVITVGCNEKSTQADEETELAGELVEVVLEEEIEEEPKPAEELEEVVLEEEIEEEPKAEEIEAKEKEEEDNAAIVPTKCSDYSAANNNLDQCGTKNLGKDKKNKAIKCDLDVKNNKCKRVNSCESIISGPDKGQSRCQPQGCFWRKEKSIFGKIKENSKESCHTTGEDEPKNK